MIEQLIPAFGHAEGDALNALAPVCEPHLEMGIARADDARLVGDIEPIGGQSGGGIVGAEGFESGQVGDQLGRQGVERDDVVDTELGPQIRRRSACGI